MEPVKPQMVLLWLHGEASLASRWSQPGSVSGSMVEPEELTYQISPTVFALAFRAYGGASKSIMGDKYKKTL